jgi:hypothetical protein
MTEKSEYGGARFAGNSAITGLDNFAGTTLGGTQRGRKVGPTPDPT